MQPTTERTVDEPGKRLDEGVAAERIKNIRDAKRKRSVLRVYGKHRQADRV